MQAPKPPTPDPAIAAAQLAEQNRATASLVDQTQMGLSADTMALQRRFGSMAASMAAPKTPAAPAVTPTSNANVFG